MTRPSYDDRLVPLTSDSLIEERVRSLIGRANCRQLWLLFLDGQDRQLPLLIPIDGLPTIPTEPAMASVVGNLAEVMRDIDAARLIVVWERCAPPALRPQDTEWAKCFSRACANAHIGVRAMLLSHSNGVRWIGPDDYLA